MLIVCCPPLPLARQAWDYRQLVRAMAGRQGGAKLFTALAATEGELEAALEAATTEEAGGCTWV